jgi:hypothetical protein
MQAFGATAGKLSDQLSPGFFNQLVEFRKVRGADKALTFPTLVHDES